MKNIPQSHQDLLRDDKKAFAVLATIMHDGTPQATPIWFNTDGEYILLNSAKGRVKDRNLRRRPNIALVINDPENPYKYMQLRGRVVEIVEEGASQHIDELAHKYTGAEKYTGHQPGEVRVTYKILPEHVSNMG